ncbi:NAD-dependent epimerase/dehydratase family protein [Halocola ammonii]
MNLVTGSTGLIGSHLLIDLLKKGESVRAMKRKTSDISVVKDLFRFYQCESLFSKIEWVDADVTDVPALEEVMTNVSRVFHCAAVVSFHPSDEEKMFKINVEGTANVVNVAMAVGVEKLIYTSSVAALGRNKAGEHIDENSTWKSGSFNTKYAVTKNAAENEVWRGIEEGLSAAMVNPGVVIGPGDSSRSSGALLGKVDSGLKFYPTGTNGFVDARDVSKAMIRLAESDISEKRFILVSENLKFKELLDTMANKLGKKPPSVAAKPWLLKLATRAMWLLEKLTGKKALVTRDSVRSSPHDFFYDNARAKKELEIDFIPVVEAVENAVAFLRKNY